MIPVTSFAGKRVALFGLGGSGLATARALLEGGADVAAYDDNPGACDAAQAQGLTITELKLADWNDFTALILSPGVPLTHPQSHWSVQRAREAGIEIIGDIELFCRERGKLAANAPFIAITGTNGKSTTTALIAHLFRAFGHDVQLGGNIGTPVLALEPPRQGRVHVIELSSFQIDLTPSLNPSVGVLLNLTPDHLDRHGTMDVYAAIKERCVASADRAVIAIDDEYTRAIAERLRRAGKPLTRVLIAHHELRDGIVVEGELLIERRRGHSHLIASLAGISSLRGRHNAQNAACAVAALGELAHDRARLQDALQTFPGLPHRMEEVGRRGRVLFINDSKATNADAAEKALSSFDPIYWIAGGKGKEGGIEPLRPLFPRIASAYLIGAAANDFARTLEGSVAYDMCGTLDVAIDHAAHDAAASQADEPVVLLSPACASYDQFANFEGRGDRFRELARAYVGPITSASGDAR
ncbi:MAG: UDP-N-acetylmuramoylalanine--D-glutamate ligase [Methylobacteriaceae bacterium]|jgi:UDP-N-acetylmuramoylalanine--D-glutamate ligase|nr:UDP-N-acetylmuramoylalanine--D-glutamate ligase [Methylobacteriaceae bacterium]